MLISRVHNKLNTSREWYLYTLYSIPIIEQFIIIIIHAIDPLQVDARFWGIILF